MDVLLNADAGTGARGGADAQAIGAQFAQHGVAARVQVLPGAALDAELQALLRNPPPAIVVGGGDGTLSSVAGLLAGTETALGVLPFGTLNHFAQDVGAPRDWTEAVAQICRGEIRRVDVAEVNGRIFLNTCSIGSYVEALRRRERLRRHEGHGKWRAMFWACLSVLRRVPRVHVQIRSQERTVDLRASFVLISNNRYQEDVIVSGRRTDVETGRLCLYASHVHRYRDLIRTAITAWRQGLSRTTALEIWETQAVELKFREPVIPVAVDGEMLEMSTPLRLRVRPRALKVLAPARS